MPLMQGDLLGHYKISAMIGKGGMGEVYRARDTKLAREVAIKVLPDTLAQHPDRLARLEREAKVLAALNHPNIAIIHGLEPGAIIMELVEGPTLADRLKSGPLPLEEALTISRQVAEALEAAHEKGVVHRDLKPANIKITLEGAVKVLDFGLATAVQGGDRDSADAANSPTLTMGATEAGVILGTAAYMSPEQASGKRVDKRSDIWSFGVVLWEILTGKPLFGEDETISHTLADVLRAEIDFTKLPASVAEPIRLLLRRCLTRDVRKRLRDIGEARIILENPESQRQISPRAESRPTRVSLLWPIAALLLLSMLAAVSFVHFREQPPTADVIRFQIPAPEKASLVAVPPIISPDGHKVVFLASDEGGRSRLWVRSVDALDARPLNVTEAGTSNSFWSPDSRFVAFAQENKLKRGSERGYA